MQERHGDADAAGRDLRRSLVVAVPAGLAWWVAMGWAIIGRGPVPWALLTVLLVPPMLGAAVLACDLVASCADPTPRPHQRGARPARERGRHGTNDHERPIARPGPAILHRRYRTDLDRPTRHAAPPVGFGRRSGQR